MPDERERVDDSKNALRGFVFLDALVRLIIYGAAGTLTLASMAALAAWPADPPTDARLAWDWMRAVLLLILLFNLFYVALLVLLRLPIPRPRPGEYVLAAGKTPDRALVYSCLIATLTKARYDAPFPAFLVFHVANLPPLCWLMNRVFGPRSQSCYVTDPRIIDPHLVTIGRNVIIGFGSMIAGHHQEQDRVVIQPTVIEDDVLIGGYAAISGAHIKKGAKVGAGSVVLPGSVIGEYEYWSGNPARRRQRLKQRGDAESPKD